jgi:hypothetical protein
MERTAGEIEMSAPAMMLMDFLCMFPRDVEGGFLSRNKAPG